MPERYVVYNHTKHLNCGYARTVAEAINRAQIERVVFPKDRIVAQDRLEYEQDGEYRVIYP